MAAFTPSSTSPAPDFFDYLASSFRLIEAGLPAAYHAVGATAGELSARLVADGRACVLRFQDGAPVFEPDRPADVEVIFDSRIVLALIDGEVSLEEALLADRLQIRGTPAAVERLHGALLLYLNGAIRVVECLALLQRFRATSLFA